MKLKQSIRYQLIDYRLAIVIYYCAVIAVPVLLTVGLATLSGSSGVYLSGGISAFSALFLFICGMCSVHEILPMSLQNGVSRRTMFLARLCVTGIVAALMAVVDALLSVVIDLTLSPLWGGGSSNLFIELFDLAHMNFETVAGATLLSVPYSFCLLVFVSALGYFVILVFYRLSLPLRIVLAVLLVLTMGPGQIAVKMVDQVLLHNFLADTVSVKYVSPLLHAIEISPYWTMVAWLVAAAVLSALSWLLLRKAVVRR
ncbi:MAG: hypothetical protein ACOYJZ_04390 [Acutalibacter sp.]|jgi:hypothetical protein